MPAKRLMRARAPVKSSAKPELGPLPPMRSDLSSYSPPTPSRPNGCVWPKCNERPDGLEYLSRKICTMHSWLAYNWLYPRQLVVEALNLIPSPHEERAWMNMSYTEREAKVKGMPCQTCGRNCPDVGDRTERVWCWKCVQDRKYDGAPEKVERAQPLAGPAAVRKLSAPKGPSQLDGMLAKVAEGKSSLYFEGGKGNNVFTQGAKAGLVAVQDHKGITTYDLKNEDHNRIVSARLQRWLRKGEPSKETAAKVPVKGPKLEVRIKGGADAD